MMTDPLVDETLWWTLLVVGSVVAVVVSLLLGLVIGLLRQIDRHAARTHTVGKQVAQNTVALWTLEQTNRDLVAIRDAARAAGQAGGGGGDVSPLDAVSQRVHTWLSGAASEEDRSSSS